MRNLHFVFNVESPLHSSWRNVLYIVIYVTFSPLRMVGALVDPREFRRTSSDTERNVIAAYRFGHDNSLKMKVSLKTDRKKPLFVRG